MIDLGGKDPVVYCQGWVWREQMLVQASWVGKNITQ